MTVAELGDQVAELGDQVAELGDQVAELDGASEGGDSMPLVICNNGLISDLTELVTQYAAGFQVGLYQNNWTPVQGSVIGDVTPATFSGYAGLISLVGWDVPTIVGARAVSAADLVSWVHNGGATSNLIYGVYVVNGSGVLMWAERDPAAPRSMVALNDTYAYVAQHTQRSEF